MDGHKIIDEKVFCRGYRKRLKSFLSTPNYETAVALLHFNPEEYKAFSVLKGLLGPGTAQSQFSLTTELLRKNPRASATWTHRRFVWQMGNQESWTDDSQFILEILDYDPRNSLCWAYVQSTRGCTAEFASKMINKSLSNYSAFNMLTQINGEDNLPPETLKDFVFTDPEISSPWTFCLAKSEKERYANSAVYLRVYTEHLLFCLIKPVKFIATIETKTNLPIQYTANYKKQVPIPLTDFTFNDITQIKIQLHGFPNISVLLNQPYVPTPPDFLSDFLKKEPHSQPALLLKLHYDSGQAKAETIKRLISQDKPHELLYSSLAPDYTIYNCTPIPTPTNH
ncbi:hypothetical protein NEHOM01_1763 [Nematocida homosporus]|uniref:uncharacterized protein n=1 Tax=Nematocida homosporus TaxID=1912981 RepID=UPI002220F0C0|nr:uncharacterized protein NEHOM01_1763 [Nematocida homosporus]KAI5186874.1 hypothetical protein NEHOM01_1763 [Nematocida homosporus]